jgi:hypothetical protein
MNLTEISMSRAGRSSTRKDGACLVSILKIAHRGFLGRGLSSEKDSQTMPVTPDAVSGRRWTVLVKCSHS